MVMRRLTPWFLAIALSGCSACRGRQKRHHPQPTIRKRFTVTRRQGYKKMGTVSVLMYGSPMDVEAALKAKAETAKADYYVIIMIDDTMVPGQWYSQAILYRK